MPVLPRLSFLGRSIKARFRLMAASGLFMGLVAPMAATAQSLSIDYDLSLIGLPIGRASLAGNADPGTYRLELTAQLTGLASVVSGGKGTAVASGTGLPSRVTPSAYQLSVSGSGPLQSIKLGFNGGNVTSIAIDPPLEPRPDRVPVTDQHRRGVLDPVSAFLMPVPGRAPILDPASCNRTLPIFDGGGRFEVSMKFKEATTLKFRGYDGPALLCDVRYTPIAGHRAERRAVQFMADNRDIQVWLVPVGSSRLLVPARIMLRTMIGMLMIDARRMTIGGKALPPDETPSPAPDTSYPIIRND
jgi:hypothetical protein